MHKFSQKLQQFERNMFYLVQYSAVSLLYVTQIEYIGKPILNVYYLVKLHSFDIFINK